MTGGGGWRRNGVREHGREGSEVVHLWSCPSHKCLVLLYLSVLKGVSTSAFECVRTVCFSAWSSPSKVTTFCKMKRILVHSPAEVVVWRIYDFLTFSFFRQDLIFNNRWKQLCLKHVPSCVSWNLPANDGLRVLKVARTPFWQTQAWVRWVWNTQFKKKKTSL